MTWLPTRCPRLRRAISIFDAAGNALAYAVKQPIEPAIIVKSKLPFDLIVAERAGPAEVAGAGVDGGCGQRSGVHAVRLAGLEFGQRAVQFGLVR